MNGQAQQAVIKPEWLKGPVVIALVIGVAVGLLIGRLGRIGPTGQIKPSEEMKAETVDNKVVKFVSKSVSGKVSNVSGNQLTISDQGDSLAVLVAGNARVEKVTVVEPETGSTNPPPPPQRTVISLSEVKIGDQVTALLSSQPDGSFQATSVTVSETR